VLARDVGIFDGQIAALLATTDNESVFVHDGALALIPDDEL
jgi:hypothetical protein